MTSRPILEGSEAFAKVRDELVGPGPAAIGKLGTIELELAYYRFKTKKDQRPIPEQLLVPLSRNAGMFPPTQETALKMADELLKSLLFFTITSPWWAIPQSLELYNTLSRSANFVTLQALECFLSPNPDHWWTASIPSNTKVLIISPFSSSIERQIPNLDKIWASRPGLWNPTTKFQTIKFPLSYGTQSQEIQKEMTDRWSDSLGLLAWTKEQMDSLDYDIAMIGAGIYSLPLMAFAKQRGKKAIHLGGSTQLFFGIRGGRWDTMTDFQPLFNEHWIRPALEERPVNYTSVEKGCYW
uniref:Uncharacterized protein n=1 Tax=viral metagenome TaxID=1070528 RepID=A0A6C0DGP5_9ZZZZ